MSGSGDLNEVLASWAGTECLTRSIGARLTKLGTMFIASDDEVISLWLRRHGLWEEFESSSVAPLMNGRRVVNFGCNIGWYTRLAAICGANRVFGVDSHPRAVAIS